MSKEISTDPYYVHIDDLVQQYKQADGPLMKLANLAGSKIDDLLQKVPDGFEAEVQKTIKKGLEKAYDASDTISKQSFLPNVPNYFHKTAVSFSGAIGGLTGLPGAVAELPITITTMFSSFQKISEEYGFERSEPETKLECLKVFTMGGPLKLDEDIDLSFVSARLGLSGQAVSNIISAASTKLTVMITQKLGSQAVPIIGALTGAALNYTFMSYYEQMAHIRFKLKKLQYENPDKNPLSDFVNTLEQQNKSSRASPKK